MKDTLFTISACNASSQCNHFQILCQQNYPKMQHKPTSQKDSLFLFISLEALKTKSTPNILEGK